MKKYMLLIISSLLMLYSCDKDNMTNSGEIGTFVVSIDDALKFVPVIQYQRQSSVTYVNMEGEIRTMDVGFQSGKKKKVFDGVEYETEEVLITLTDEQMLEAGLSITASANYSKRGEPPLQFVWATLTTSLNNGYVPSARLDGDGKPIICNFNENVVLNQRDFQNVYYNFEAPDHITSFSQIYYNSEYGIVAYRDQNNELWVFDEWN